MDALTWRRSSYSGANGGNCVEVAVLSPEIGLRDSKDPAAGQLAVGRAAFAALVEGLKAWPRSVL